MTGSEADVDRASAMTAEALSAVEFWSKSQGIEPEAVGEVLQLVEPDSLLRDELERRAAARFGLDDAWREESLLVEASVVPEWNTFIMRSVSAIPEGVEVCEFGSCSVVGDLQISGGGLAVDAIGLRAIQRVRPSVEGVELMAHLSDGRRSVGVISVPRARLSQPEDPSAAALDAEGRRHECTRASVAVGEFYGLVCVTEARSVRSYEVDVLGGPIELKPR